MNDLHYGLILLLKSAVTGEKLALPEGFSLEDAVEIIKKQHLMSLVYQGALNCEVPSDTPIMRELLRAYYQLLVKSERQMLAVERIFRAFDENGVDYLPLKGCNMKKLYPKPELRLMGDVDILIRTEQYGKVQSAMESIGFKFLRLYDNVYEWDSDALHVELHKFLMSEGNEDYGEYYGDGWKFARKGEGTRYDLSNEDAFVFMFAHFAKHYRYAGIGCRHVLDIYVFRREVSGLDEKYIRAELEKLGLLEFYLNMLRTLDNWFNGGEADEVTELITAYIFSGGSWGSLESAMHSAEVRRAANQDGVRNSKLRSIINTLFLPLVTMKKIYPVLNKAPVLLPVFWVVHGVDVVIHRPQKIVSKTKIWRKLNDESVDSRRRALELVGLSFNSAKDELK